jgi:hypothetical protein
MDDAERVLAEASEIVDDAADAEELNVLLKLYGHAKTLLADLDARISEIASEGWKDYR